jgi:hypothetical protein
MCTENYWKWSFKMDEANNLGTEAPTLHISLSKTLQILFWMTALGMYCLSGYRISLGDSDPVWISNIGASVLQVSPTCLPVAVGIRITWSDLKLRSVDKWWVSGVTDKSPRPEERFRFSFLLFFSDSCILRHPVATCHDTFSEIKILFGQLIEVNCPSAYIKNVWFLPSCHGNIWPMCVRGFL